MVDYNMVGQTMKLCSIISRGKKLFSFMGILASFIIFLQFWLFPYGTHFSTLSHSVDHITFDLVITSKDNVSDHDVTFDQDDSETDVDSVNSLSLMTKSRIGVDKMVIYDNGTSNGEGYTDLSVGDLSNLTNVSSLSVTGINGVGEMGDALRNESMEIERYVRRMRGVTIALSDMNSMLLKGSATSTSVRHRRSTARDRQLRSARLQIENAHILRNVKDLHVSVFRNVSRFKRSYDLMERTLKIYVYKEGEKPIFHQPMLRGLYAAEGWFMKLMERSKHFTVRDPKKAHLFYLPFSANTLRSTLYEKYHSVKNLEHYLSDYIDLIKKKYSFWNRTGGADHFLVACHDWAPRITRHHLSSCIRALCNANVARGFNIGKDVSIPVTYIRSGNDPLRDIGGKPPSERDILAFFAGQMHGYLRPLLLKYWENKSPDMKIFGAMRRDIEGKAVYREFMKSSKYCICARGYEVHTPRVVESISYECVPVIISDNYVPPFFEVLDWEAFTVFVPEKDIPNLRDILLSIPEERYLDMHQRVKMVQPHFSWHKFPEKYDLFHMILYSVWYNRVLHTGTN